jgi:hypothetical protein
VRWRTTAEVDWKRWDRNEESGVVVKVEMKEENGPGNGGRVNSDSLSSSEMTYANMVYGQEEKKTGEDRRECSTSTLSWHGKDARLWIGQDRNRLTKRGI